jgi:hypothetical protein
MISKEGWGAKVSNTRTAVPEPSITKMHENEIMEHTAKRQVVNESFGWRVIFIIFSIGAGVPLFMW